MPLGPCEMFKVLSVETRVKIIDLLKSQGPLGVKKIAEVLDITPAAVSQHLKVLRQAGFVRNERKGYWIPYSIDERALEDCRSTLNEVCTCGCEGSRRFKEQAKTEVSLVSLMKHKEELEEELTNVRERISEIKAREQ